MSEAEITSEGLLAATRPADNKIIELLEQIFSQQTTMLSGLLQIRQAFDSQNSYLKEVIAELSYQSKLMHEQWKGLEPVKACSCTEAFVAKTPDVDSEP